MKLESLRAAAAVLALAAGGLGAAHARDVYWSVGIQAAPGVTVGLGNTPPVVAAPVYMAPAPVYLAPPPVVLVRPAPVVYSAPVVYAPGYAYYVPRKHKHKRHHYRY